MRLSIIIPCYNSAATICRCLDSIYAMPLAESEFEVIVVDDASRDETGKIVEEYVKAHANLTLIRHLVNRNVGGARNTGLAAAKGNCIAFVDSDDEVAPGVVCAMKMMEERQLDMVAMRIEAVDKDGNVTGQMGLPYSQDEVFFGIQLQEEHAYWSSAAWTYLYSKAIIAKVGYPFVEGVYYEDFDFVCTHLYQAKRMSYCNEFCYRYYRNPLSVSHTKSPQHAFGQAYLGSRMLEIGESIKSINPVFANTLQEGGSWNLIKAFHSLHHLECIADVHVFYKLFDSKVNRKDVQKSLKSADLTYWTKMGLSVPIIIELLAAFFVFLRKVGHIVK